jgi:hypothetical protein
LERALHAYQMRLGPIFASAPNGEIANGGGGARLLRSRRPARDDPFPAAADALSRGRRKRAMPLASVGRAARSLCCRCRLRAALNAVSLGTAPEEAYTPAARATAPCPERAEGVRWTPARSPPGRRRTRPSKPPTTRSVAPGARRPAADGPRGRELDGAGPPPGCRTPPRAPTRKDRRSRPATRDPAGGRRLS